MPGVERGAGRPQKVPSTCLESGRGLPNGALSLVARECGWVRAECGRELTGEAAVVFARERAVG